MKPSDISMFSQINNTSGTIIAQDLERKKEKKRKERKREGERRKEKNTIDRKIVKVGVSLCMWKV